MTQLEKYKFKNEPIRILEFFSGVGMQRMAFDKLGVNYESVGTSEIDIPAILSYAAIHDGLLESDETFEYPTKEEMLNYLSERNIGLDFKTGKLKLPKNLDKIKQLYRAVILSKCLGDISKINPSELPDFDFMTYSFPCQSISVSGRTEGIIRGQTRSGLLYECEKVIEHKRPKYLLLENVKNLVGKQFKPQFDEWLEYLESLGYTNYWKVLNSRDFGVPQNRERVFVLSILGEHDPYEFHSGFELDIRLKDVLESDIDEKYYINTDRANQLIQKLYNTGQITDDIVACDSTILNPKALEVGNCITARYDAGIQNKGSIGIAVCEAVSSKRIGGLFDDEKHVRQWDTSKKQYNSQQDRAFYDEKLSGTIATNAMANVIGNSEPLICASRGRNPENPSDRTDGITNTLTTVQKDNYLFEPQTSKDTCKVIDCGHIPYETNTEKKHQSNTVYSENGLNPTLNATDYKNPTKIISYDNFRIRKLTPKECWRLMGIDDECFDKAQQVNSNSQLYKQAGNGIVVNVLYYIFKELFKDSIVDCKEF